MPKANLSHDLSFLRQDGSTEIGLILAKDKSGIPVYGEFDDPSLAQQFFSGEPGYANLPPEKEIQIGQDDWRSGVGQEVFDTSDKKRYWKSVNMDLRFKGMAQCGPLATEMVKPAGVVRAWAEFSDDLYIGVDDRLCRLNGVGDRFGEVKRFTGKNITDIEPFTDDNMYIALGKGNFYYYMPSELVIEDCEDAWNEQVVGGVTSETDDTAGNFMNGTKSIKLSMSLAAAAGILATEDVGSLNLTTYTDVTFWIKSSVALDANDLQLLLDDSPNCGSPVEELNIPDVAANTWTSVHMAFAAPAGLGAVASIGIKMIVDKDVFILHIDDVRVGTYTLSNIADGKADFFQTVGTNFWKACTPRELKSAVGGDPTNGSTWSIATNVGSTAEDVTALGEESGNLYVMKEDMPWYIDTDGNVHRLIPGLKTLTASTSGVNSFVWKAKLYIPCGTQSLVEYDCVSEVQSWRDPADFCDNLTEYTGRVQALAGDDRYLYAITDNNGLVELLAGRLEQIDGSTDWVWHPLAELEITNCQIAFASSIHKKRLYVASTVGTEDLTYYPLPTTYGDIDAGADYTFQSNGYFITPWHHANFRGDRKAYIKLTLLMEDTSATEYFEAYYRVEGVAAWTKIDDFKASPATTKYIPISDEDLNPVGTMIKFQILAKTGDPTTTPKLLGYDCRGIWYPEKRKIISARILCADNLTMKNGGTDLQTAATIKTAIDEAGNAAWPLTFYDIDGNTVYVKLLSQKEYIAEVGKERNKERVYDLMLSKVALEAPQTGMTFNALWDYFVWG